MSELFRTAAGSEVTVDGHTVNVSFHTLDEGAHRDVKLEVDIRDPDNAWLHWDCACCEPGQARLDKVHIPGPTSRRPHAKLPKDKTCP